MVDYTSIPMDIPFTVHSQSNPICPVSDRQSQLVLNNIFASFLGITIDQYEGSQARKEYAVGNNRTSHKWCSFQVVDPDTAIIQMVYAGIIMLMLVWIISNLSKLIKNNYFKTRINPNLTLLISLNNNSNQNMLYGWEFFFVHAVVLLWWISTFARIAISLYTYYQYMENDFNNNQGKAPQVPDPELSDPIIKLVNAYNFTNFLAPFFINLLMLVIARQWLWNLLQKIRDNQQLLQNQHRMIYGWFRKLKWVKFYYRILRQLVLAIFLAETLAFYEVESIRCLIVQFNICITIAQSLLILSFYIFAASIFQKIRDQQIILIQNTDRSRIIKQYGLLFISFLSRIALNSFPLLFYYVLTLEQLSYMPNGNCSNKNQNDSLLILVLALHHLFMHILPISVVLYIYLPRSPQKMQNSTMQYIASSIDGSEKLDSSQVEETFITYANTSNISEQTEMPIQSQNNDVTLKKKITARDIFRNRGIHRYNKKQQKGISK